MNWDQRKAKVIAAVQSQGAPLFINPMRRPQDYQAALELVGKGILVFDGATFRIAPPATEGAHE